jgi:hypothetical protein
VHARIWIHQSNFDALNCKSIINFWFVYIDFLLIISSIYQSQLFYNQVILLNNQICLATFILVLGIFLCNNLGRI